MHSVVYRTELLRDMGLELPKHVLRGQHLRVMPLPHVRTIYYRDVDMYRYYIGRHEDQKREQSVAKGRIDQLRHAFMIDAVQLPDATVPEKRLERYMENYLSMMMCICSIFLRMIGTDEAEDKREEHLGLPQGEEPRGLAHPPQRAEHGHQPAHRAGPQDRHHRRHGPEDIQVH